METLVFVFSGFLESGKTNFINETLRDPNFSTGEKTLLIACEEGMEEYDTKELEKYNTYLVSVDEQEELTPEFLKKVNAEYRPKRVLIEYNGMWQLDYLLELPLPRTWVIAQQITTVDMNTCRMYINNMKGLLTDKFVYADLVVFNRCDLDVDKASYRRIVKAMNRRAEVVFEDKTGNMIPMGDEDLPFDIKADVIEIDNEDFGIWYLDAMENTDKYVGKTVKFLGIVYKDKKLAKGMFAAGRFAMTCCADDIAYIGVMCKSDFVDKLELRQWITVTAKVEKEYVKQYQGEGPVLYPVSIEPGKKPEGDDLVYFN